MNKVALEVEIQHTKIKEALIFMEDWRHIKFIIVTYNIGIYI